MTQLAIAPLDTIDDILSWKRYSFAKNQSPISISKRFLREYFTLHHSKTPHHNTLPTEHVEVHSNCSLSSQFSMAYTNDCVSGNANFNYNLLSLFYELTHIIYFCVILQEIFWIFLE